MKNIAKHIMATVALAAGVFSFGMPVFAQDDEINVSYGKTVTPKPDTNGVYTISIEAYVTGSVTVETSAAPADIVLVLDYSNSMRNDISNLRSAVKGFVDQIKTSNESVLATEKDTIGEELVGHRIAFVLFSGGVYNYTNLNNFLNVDKITTGTNAVYYNNSSTNIIGYDLSQGTYSGDAMEKAREIISGVDYSQLNENRTKIVVFFTDGEPGNRDDSWGNANSGRTAEATQCIAAAYDLKKNYGAIVYSVGLLGSSDDGTQVSAFLKYTSSDDDETQVMPTSAPSGGWPKVTGDHSILVTNSDQLRNVFGSIANNTGGDYDAASSSSVLVDIVAQSFSIPEDTDLGTVKVYQVKCTQSSATALISWSETKEDITSSVTLDTTTPNEVSVSGFDYGANWCGWDDSAKKEHGYKLVLEIPIVVRAEAIGGPSVITNTSDSKLVLRDAEGKEIKSYDLPQPSLPIPVSIWIEKHGLVDDDSAVFTLARALYHSGASYDDYVTGAYKDTWENFTKVIVNEKNMQTVTVDGVEHKVVKISGLDPDYYYRIKEDAWAWGYPVQIGGVQYTIGDNLQNPLQVYNTPDPDAPKHAEAVVRNVFKERTAEWTTNQ